jgi:spore coat protein U-like protein
MNAQPISAKAVIFIWRGFYANFAKCLSVICVLSLFLFSSGYANAFFFNTTNSEVTCKASMSNLEFGSVDFVTNPFEKTTTGTLSYTCSNNTTSTKTINICFYMINNSPSAVASGWHPLTNNASVLAVQFRSFSNVPIARVINEKVILAKKTSNTWNIPIKAVLNVGQVPPNVGTHSLAFHAGQTGISFLTGTATSAPSTCGTSIETDAFSFDVKATVVSACLISLVNDLNFGIVSPSNATQTLDAQSNLAFRCTKNIPYRVSLLSKNAKNNQFNMIGARMGTTAFIPYYIYKDPARTMPWNSRSPLSSVGTGYDQTYTVYGRTYIPSFEVPASEYSDTNTIQITY